MEYIFIFTSGLIIGSFFNVYVSRRLEGGSLLWPPSQCDHCGTRLSKIQLIPVVGYLLQKGKCFYCKEKISVKYTIFELLYGLIFLFLFIEYPIFSAFIYAGIISILIAMARIDFETFDVYLVDLIILWLLVLPLSIVHGNSILKIILHTCLFILCFSILRREKYLGTGDIVLFILITMSMNFREGIGFFLVFGLIGGLLGIILLLLGKSRKAEIPLVPIITMAYLFYLPLSDMIYRYLGWGM